MRAGQHNGWTGRGEVLATEANERELADDKAIQEMKTAWQYWGSNPDAFRSVPWGEAVGWKD